LSLRANDIEVVLPLISKHFFSGRQLIWEQFFSDINRSLAIKLFGMGESYRVVIGSRVVGNLHNIFLTLLQYIGIVGSSLFFALLIKFISGMYKDTAPSADQITMYIIFLTSLVIGFFEISFFLSYLSFPAAISLGFACNPTLSARIPKQRRL
jgi:hypothetical protein